LDPRHTANQWAGSALSLEEYVAGEKLVLERNPYYWKKDAKGNRLPYLDELVFLLCPMLTRKFCGSNPANGSTQQAQRREFSVLGRQQRASRCPMPAPVSNTFPVLQFK